MTFMPSESISTSEPISIPAARKLRCSAAWVSGFRTAASQAKGRCQKQSVTHTVNRPRRPAAFPWILEKYPAL